VEAFDLRNKSLACMGASDRRLVVIDKNIMAQADRIHSYFAHHNITADIFPIEAGEGNKSLEGLTRVLERFDAFSLCRREEPVIAVGGGVLTDLVGFAAAIYRRGVPHIKIPTTLMGYIDAAIGIKCGVNFNDGKNRLGAFEPPLAVFLDPSFLKTLPQRHILNGLAEIIKLAIVCDDRLFLHLEKDGMNSARNKFQDSAGLSILDNAIDAMLSELSPNLYENNLARAADFGHTVSLAYEMAVDSRLLHGEAVLIDIILSTFLARNRGCLTTRDAERILALINSFSYVLSPLPLISEGEIWESLCERACHRGGRQHLPLPCGIGRHIFTEDVTPKDIGTTIIEANDWISRHIKFEAQRESLRKAG